jgi:hypothetical protein
VGLAAENPRKLKFSKSLGIAFAAWVVFVAVRVGLAWIFS